MARNRTSQDREEKRREIIDAATRLFAADGYEATSIGALAREAGITPNTIYWYFDDKDAVLVEVLRGIVRASVATFRDQDLPTLTDRLLWLTGVFEEMAGLTITVHARAPVSESVRAWHRQFHQVGDAWLLDEARQHLAQREDGRGVDADALAAIPRIWSYAIEGMIAHDLSDDERRHLCGVLVKQLDAL